MQPNVPVYFAAIILVAQAIIAFIVAGGAAVGIPQLYLFILAAVGVGLNVLSTFLNIHSEPAKA